MVDKTDKLAIDMTFLSDTSIAFNFDALKNCAWNFMKFKKTENGVYLVNKERIDTVWLKVENGKIVIFENKKKRIFEKSEFAKSKIDSLISNVKKIKDFSDKNITFDCKRDITEIPYFYENAIEEIKSKLKNPNTAKFKGAFITTYEDIINGEFKETDITTVSLEVEATNSFGAFTIGKFYVFFTPEKNNPRNFKITSGDSPLYKSATDELDALDIK